MSVSVEEVLHVALYILRAVRQPHASAQLLFGCQPHMPEYDMQNDAMQLTRHTPMTYPVHLVATAPKPDTWQQHEICSDLFIAAHCCHLMLFRQTKLRTHKVADPAYNTLPDAAPAAVYLDCLYYPPWHRQICKSTSYCGLM